MYPPHLFNSAFRATEGWRENASLTRRPPPPFISVLGCSFLSLDFLGFLPLSRTSSFFSFFIVLLSYIFVDAGSPHICRCYV